MTSTGAGLRQLPLPEEAQGSNLSIKNTNKQSLWEQSQMTSRIADCILRAQSNLQE